MHISHRKESLPRQTGLGKEELRLSSVTGIGYLTPRGIWPTALLSC